MGQGRCARSANGAKTLKVRIPGQYPSLNEYIAACGEHRGKWRKGAAMKARDMEIMGVYIKHYIKGPVMWPLRLEFTYYMKDLRTDLDNISGYYHKVFQDALVDQKIIPNDNPSYIVGYKDTFLLDRHRPRTEILIREGQKGDWEL